MYQTRHLLLDCRAALRRTEPGFEDTPLGERLDAAILAMGQEDDARRASEQPVPVNPVAARVAYAWQSAARDLRHSHPELHQQLASQVLKRLDVDTMDDPGEEIEDLQRKLDQARQQVAKAEAELETLRMALAEATVRPPGPAPAAAPLAAAAEASSFPDAVALQAVASGARSFTRHELDCCISEALVRTGFQRTPVQLLEDGETGLARLLLEPAAGA